MQGEKLETKHNHRNSQIVHDVIRSWARPVSCSRKRLLKAVLPRPCVSSYNPNVSHIFIKAVRWQSKE